MKSLGKGCTWTVKLLEEIHKGLNDKDLDLFLLNKVNDFKLKGEILYSKSPLERTEECINEEGHYYTKNYYKVLGFEKINLKEEEKKLLNKKEESFEDEEIIW